MKYGESQRNWLRGTGKSLRVIDPSLVGVWNNGGSALVEIDGEGWLYSLSSPIGYSISPDGQQLTFTSANPPAIYGLEIGDGQSLVGVWKMRQMDGADIWIEEIYYRANGTYTTQFLVNGNFESEIIGSFEDDGLSIRLRERRALIETGPGNDIVVDQLYGPMETGTYSVAPTGEEWTFEGPGKDIVYVKVILSP